MSVGKRDISNKITFQTDIHKIIIIIINQYREQKNMTENKEDEKNGRNLIIIIIVYKMDMLNGLCMSSLKQQLNQRWTLIINRLGSLFG